MTERENFETWYASLYPDSSLQVVREWLLTQDDGTYDDPIEQHWLAWQEARKQALAETRAGLTPIAEVREEVHGGVGRSFYLSLVARGFPPVGTTLYAEQACT